MKRTIIYLAWAWEILIGVLLITPKGIICIACGTVIEAPGYVGETAVRVIAVVAILLGIYGITTVGGAAKAATGTAAGR